MTILGAGSFGTAMAAHAASMADGREVCLWCRRPEQARRIRTLRENPEYLKGIGLAATLVVASDLAEALAFSDALLLAVPAQSLRALAEEIARLRPQGAGFRLVNLAKGIEVATGNFLHRAVGEVLPDASYTALSGPSHAEEVGRGLPTALVAASADEDAARFWQEALNDERLRVYTSTDLAGVEAGGAMKNVIAIAVGVARAIGFGDNSVAALATRGLAEIMRYGAQIGANPLTLAGLAGLGDLMATCYSMHSRNLRFGMAVGRGKDAEAAAAEIGQVVEGMHTVRALVVRAREGGLSLPISEGVYRVLYEGETIRGVLTELMFREPKPEIRGGASFFPGANA